MKTIIWSILALCVFGVMPTGIAQEGNSQPVINLIIDVVGTLHPSEDQAAAERDNIRNVYNSMIADRIPSTMFLAEEVSSSQLSLFVTQLGLYGNIEFGMSGNNSNEKLSSMSYTEQLASLKTSKKYADACHACGQNEMLILGFRPQSYDQNQDTYRVLDEIGILYDAGFQAGLLFEPSRENDVWPYPIEGHNFYAVPISTHTFSGEKTVLQDSYFLEKGLTASQWYDALEGKLDEIQGRDEPMVIVLTTSVSGSGDYLDALNKFIAYAKSENASFVTTKQLVDMSKLGIHDPSALPTGETTECETCKKEESVIDSPETIKISTNATNASDQGASTGNTSK